MSVSRLQSVDIEAWQVEDTVISIPSLLAMEYNEQTVTEKDFSDQPISPPITGMATAVNLQTMSEALSRMKEISSYDTEKKKQSPCFSLSLQTSGFMVTI
jgi:hypothetical protein